MKAEGHNVYVHTHDNMIKPVIIITTDNADSVGINITLNDFLRHTRTDRLPLILV